jgi:hypothetical protein
MPHIFTANSFPTEYLPKKWVVRITVPSQYKYKYRKTTKTLKLAYRCSCGNKWTSMRGMVIVQIWMLTSSSPVNVHCELFKQNAKDATCLPSI